MLNLNGQWSGNTIGTDILNVYAKFDNNNEIIFADIRVRGSDSKIYKYLGSSNIADNGKLFNIEEFLNSEKTGISGNLIFNVIRDNFLEGEWEFNNAAKGIIRLYKVNKDENVDIIGEEPSNITTTSYFINLPYKLYRSDIEEIIDYMRKIAGASGHFSINVKNYEGRVKSFYVNDFLKMEKYLTEISDITFNVQILNKGIANILTLNLSSKNQNNIICQSPDPIWSEATPMLLKNIIERRANKILNIYKKHGIDINVYFLLALIYIAPSLSMKERFVTILGFVIFAYLHKHLHGILSQNKINFASEEPKKFNERYPKVAYIMGTIGSFLLGGICSYALSMIPKVISYIKVQFILN